MTQVQVPRSILAFWVISFCKQHRVNLHPVKRLEPQAAPAPLGASAGPVPGSSEDGLSGGDFDPGRGQQQQLPALWCPLATRPAGAGRDEAPLWPWMVEHLCTAAPCCPGGKICPGHLGLLLAPRDALQPSPRPLQLPPPPWPLLSDCLALPTVPVVHCRLLCPRCR